MHQTLGPSIPFEKFMDIAGNASLLSDLRGDKEQERIMCENAFCHSLLTTRNKDIKLSASRSQGNRKLSYGSTGYEAKNDDCYSDDEASSGSRTGSGHKYSEDPLLGVEDTLVFTEFAEAIAKLATDKVDGSDTAR